MFSKYPVISSATMLFDSSKRPYILAHLNADGHLITVAAVHVVHPTDEKYFHMQREEFHDLTELANANPKSLIIMGDLNATSWSYGFRDLMAESNLVDTRSGRGIQPSWPTYFPPMAIPIDHCLVSPNLSVLNRSIGPNVGSDHYPVLVDLSLPR